MGVVGVVVRLGIVASVAAAAVACTIETTTSTAGGPVPEPCPSCGGASGGGTSGGGKTSTGTPIPSAEPMLARVDPNVSMNATPGRGVGIFSQYDTGGHWHLWWTCDTLVTAESCPFDVKVSVGKGVLSHVATDQFASTDTIVTPATPAAGEAGAIEAKTSTTTGASGLSFDTDPGATITLTATIGGLYDGQFLFWVQDGKVNGGYKGQVTDPLMLVGSTP